jgi:hypothetical protein
MESSGDLFGSRDGEEIACGLLQTAGPELSLERLELVFGGFADGVDAADLIGESSVGKIAEARCGRMSISDCDNPAEFRGGQGRIRGWRLLSGSPIFSKTLLSKVTIRFTEKARSTSYGR